MDARERIMLRENGYIDFRLEELKYVFEKIAYRLDFTAGENFRQLYQEKFDFCLKNKKIIPKRDTYSHDMIEEDMLFELCQMLMQNAPIGFITWFGSTVRFVWIQVSAAQTMQFVTDISNACVPGVVSYEYRRKKIYKRLMDMSRKIYNQRCSNYHGIYGRTI